MPLLCRLMLTGVSTNYPGSARLAQRGYWCDGDVTSNWPRVRRRVVVCRFPWLGYGHTLRALHGNGDTQFHRIAAADQHFLHGYFFDSHVFRILSEQNPACHFSGAREEYCIPTPRHAKHMSVIRGSRASLRTLYRTFIPLNTRIVG